MSDLFSQTNVSVTMKPEKKRKKYCKMTKSVRQKYVNDWLSGMSIKLNCHAGEKEAKQMAALKQRRPELYKRVNDAVEARRAALQGGDQ